MKIDETIKSSGFKLTAIFAGGNIFSLIIGFLSGFLIAKVIDPTTLGLFSGLGLILGYIPFLQLGILNGLNRELPYWIGRGDIKKSNDLAATSQAWALIVSAVVVFALLGLAFRNAFLHKWDLFAGWITYAFAAFSLIFGQQYLQIIYRTRSDFARLSLITVINSLVSLTFIIFVLWFKFYGLCIRSFFIGATFLLFLWIWRPVKVKPKWDIENLKLLFKIGAPIFIVGQIFAWWTVLDSTFVLKYTGTKGLGLYQLSIMITTAVSVLSSAVSQIVYRKMAMVFGESHDKRKIIKVVARPILILIIIYIPIAILGYWFIEPVTKYLLPNYIGGIKAAKISLIAASLSCFYPLLIFFNVVKKQIYYLTAIISGLIIYTGSLMWFNRRGVDLSNFPLAMAIGKIAFIIISYFLILILAKKEEQHV